MIESRQDLATALTGLMTNRRIRESQFGDSLRQLTEHICEQLACERASVWSFSHGGDQGLGCIELFDRPSGEHLDGGNLDAVTSQALTDLLETHHLLVVEEPGSDPAYDYLREAYLKPNAVKSLLAVNYHFDGNLEGLLIVEQSSSKRTWSTDEQHYVTSLAGLISTLKERQLRRSVQLELSEEKERYRQMVSNSPIGFIIIVDHIIEFANDQMAQLSGLPSVDVIIGQPVDMFLHPDDLELGKTRLDLLASDPSMKPQSRPYRINAGNEELILEITSTGITWRGKPAVQSMIRDVTQQVVAEHAAKEAAQRFATLAESFPGGFTYIDNNQTYQMVNGTYASWLGITSDELIGNSLRDYVGEETYVDIEGYVEQALRGESVTFERSANYPNAGRLDVQVSYIPDWDYEQQTVKGYFSLVTDVSDVKKTEQALRQAQKMEAVGQLTGGIAHDFNNLLTIVLGNLEFIGRHVDSNSDIHEYVTHAIEGANRGANLTRKLLDFSRTDPRHEALVSVNDCIDNIYKLLQQSLTASIAIDLKLGNDLDKVKLDPGELEDTILNLSINARDAMKGSGTLTIETEQRFRRGHEVNGEQVIAVKVSDTGGGMTEDVMEKIFEPFFTTKREHEGTGLGLSMVYGFVQRANGDIEVDSTPGLGSTFTIFLPIVAELSEQVELQVEVPDSLTGKECILIVDDEPMVADVATAMLETMGYVALKCHSAAAALELLQTDHDIDLLFTDTILGGSSDGFDLAESAHRMRPDLKILITSGFNEIVTTANPFREALSSRMLAKPYGVRQLANAVRESLNS